MARIKSGNEVLCIRGMRKHLGAQRTLTADFFAANAGECALLYGDNGCGKTTFLKILAGLLAPESFQEWRIDGRAAKPERGGGIVLLHQTPYMFAASVYANVALAAANSARAKSALAWAGLSHAAATPARELSGGERARVSLARARAANIKLCLMDEPAAHLDSEGIALASALTNDLQQRGAAVVIAAPAYTTAIPHTRIWHLQNDKLHAKKNPARK